MRTSLWASALIASLLVTTPAWAQRISNPSPAQGATNVEPQSPVSVTFAADNGVTVRPETVRLSIDGTDVTRSTVVTSDFLSYRPSQPFSAGPRQVLLEFTNSAGQARRVTWSFTVGQTVAAEISSVVHNAAGRPLAAGEIMLITVNGTPGSTVTVYLVQDGRTLQNLPAQEVSSGVYVVNALVESKDATNEGIVVARLANASQVRFATAEQALRLVTGAATGQQQLSVTDAAVSGTTSGLRQPEVTNYRNGDRITDRSFTVNGVTSPNASVRIEASAETSLVGGFLGTQQTLANQTVQADSQGVFTITLRPTITTAGTRFVIRMTASQGGQTSATTTLELTQE